MEKIKNVTQEGKHSCNCVSWIAHWEKHSKHFAVFCSVDDCYNSEGIVGAQVEKIKIYKKYYVIPLCLKHRAVDHELTIRRDTILVPIKCDKT